MRIMKRRLIVIVGVLLICLNVLLNYEQDTELLVVEEDEIIEWNNYGKGEWEFKNKFLWNR